MQKQANLTAIMLVQQLEEEYWKLWNDTTPIQEAKENNDCLPLLKEVVRRLNAENIIVSEAYGIIHDKDEIAIWNQEKMQTVLERKVKHVHFLLKFEKGASLQKLALTIGIEPQYLEKLKSGRYGYENCLAYLVHAKDEAKYQYSPDEVVTLLGEDYTSLYHRKMPTWVRGRATKKAKETNLGIDWLVAEILAGRITKNNIMLTNDYYDIYGQHKRKVNEALDTAGERKSYQTIAELEAGKFKKTVIFINAESGVGKTVLSKKIIAILQSISLKQGQAWDYCITASTNAFDEYHGQEILFLDDIRGDSLTVSDWLKLLDPYMISPISARYHNKMGSAKVIIITSTKEPIDFFNQAKGNFSEDAGQFVRRIDCFVTLDSNNDVSISIPERNTQDKTIMDSQYIPRIPSYIFSIPEKFFIQKATDKLIKTVLRNLQWNKQKKIISDTDQSNKDNPNTQQK